MSLSVVSSSNNMQEDYQLTSEYVDRERFHELRSKIYDNSKVCELARNILIYHYGNDVNKVFLGEKKAKELVKRTKKPSAKEKKKLRKSFEAFPRLLETRSSLATELGREASATAAEFAAVAAVPLTGGVGFFAGVGVAYTARKVNDYVWNRFEKKPKPEASKDKRTETVPLSVVSNLPETSIPRDLSTTTKSIPRDLSTTTKISAKVSGKILARDSVAHGTSSVDRMSRIQGAASIAVSEVPTTMERGYLEKVGNVANKVRDSKVVKYLGIGVVAWKGGSHIYGARHRFPAPIRNAFGVTDIYQGDDYHSWWLANHASLEENSPIPERLRRARDLPLHEGFFNNEDPFMRDPFTGFPIKHPVKTPDEIDRPKYFERYSILKWLENRPVYPFQVNNMSYIVWRPEDITVDEEKEREVTELIEIVRSEVARIDALRP